MEINAIQTVFSVFYAIFWGVIANAQPKWRAFNWPLALRHARPLRRLALALVVLNLVPIAIFVGFFLALATVRLGSPAYQLPWGGSIPIHAVVQVFLAIIAANAPFAVHRFWIGRLESHPTCYYYRRDEKPELQAAFEPRLDESGKQPYSVALSEEWSRGNTGVSLVHFLLCFTAVVALRRGGWSEQIATAIVLLLVFVVAICALVKKDQTSAE